MAENSTQPSGPDLSQVVALETLADGGMLLGHVGDNAILPAVGIIGQPKRLWRVSQQMRPLRPAPIDG